ncbi:MAG TPA: M56 family metallopeptidase, partial [Verrucomicrobiae bacterium]|nr:M56 family metallopeptidase [Verrucomicrobiae bacterium]
MNLSFADSNFLRVFLWVLQSSLAVVVLSVVLWVVERTFRSFLAPRAVYFLWLLVVARLVWPFSPPSSFSIFNLGDPFRSRALSGAGSIDISFARDSEGSRTPSLRTREASGPSRFAEVSPPFPGSPENLLATGWLIGLVGFLSIVLIQDRRLAIWVRRQAPVESPRLKALLEQTRTLLQLHARVRVVATDCLSTPALFGFFRPCLLVPRRMLEHLSDSELRLVLLHELVHVRRRDVLWNWFMLFLQAIHWFNPAVWFAFRRLRAAREVLCDTIVLTHLAEAERYEYGRTLIKLFDYVPGRSAGASSLPILNTQTELKRRILMISNYVPPSRFAVLCTLILLGSIAGLTFTSAAPNKGAVKPALASPRQETANSKTAGDQAQRKLVMLEEQLATIDAQVRRQQAELDDLQMNLQIPSYVTDGNGAAQKQESSALQTVEGQQIEIKNEFRQVDTLYAELKSMSRAKLRKALPTALPDQHLFSLLNNLADTEQKLALLSNSYTESHPEVKSLCKVTERINSQIEECVDGIMTGLKTKHNFVQVRLDQLQKEIASMRRDDIERTAARRKYFMRKRDLENTLQVRDRIQIQLLEH